MRRVLALAAVWLAASCGGNGPGDLESLPPGANAVVERAVDGDTVRVRLAPGGTRESVRLIGVDTPETKKPGAHARPGSGDDDA